MTDQEAYIEASNSIDFLVDQCRVRNIPLTIRLNPMYMAKGSRWADIAHMDTNYKPPRFNGCDAISRK